MKVVIYTHYLASGGAEKRASVYANYLHNNGIHVVVITMHKVENEYFLDSNIERYYIAESKCDYSLLSKKQRLNKLTDILLKVKPDIVMSFLTTYGVYAALALEKSKELKYVKHIYAVSLYQRKYSLLQRIIDFFACLKADYISLQCKEQLKCNRLFRKKCFVTYNPIHDNYGKDLSRSYERLKIISAGRLTRQKNFEMTIKGVADFHKTNNNVTLDIYGKGPLRNKLEKIIHKLSADSYIKIHDFSNNLQEEFVKHNVFISSSKYEGFPNALAEAMMSGLVCLSTKCPTGPKEIISDKTNGFFIKNSKEITGILDLLSHSIPMCQRVASEARSFAKLKLEDKNVLPDFVKQLSSITK